MHKLAHNPCTRCGTERIITKTWDETLETMRGKTTVTYTESVCPNKECQKLVEDELAVQKKKRDKQREDRESRHQERMATNLANKKSAAAV